MEGELWVPQYDPEILAQQSYDAGYYAGYRQGQADEHHRWSEALKRLIKERG